MPDVKISALPASTTPLAGTEVLPIVQSATTRQVSVANLTAGRAVSALSIATTTGATFATTSGSVGIGQSSPTVKLDILNNNATYSLSQKVFNASAGTFFLGQSPSATFLSVDNFAMAFCTGSDGGVAGTSVPTNERMRITSAGLVGIGTSSPSAALSVIASPMTSQLLIGQNASASTYGAISFNGVNTDAGRSGFTGGGGDTALYYDVPGGIHTFRNAGTTQMVLNASGNLGLGTTSPSDTLSVIKSTMTNQIVMGLNTTDTTYGSISFSGSNSGANRIGLTGGGGSDKSLYLDSPTGGAFYFRINAVSRQEISSAGIVTMSAYGAGAATFAANGTISSVSDETWKTKDGVPTNTDAMLQKLEPGYWFYNEEKAPIFGQDRQLGFYAQNVREAIGEEAAPTPEEGKPWGYYDRSVLAVVVMSLKNALTTIEELKQRIATLESK